MDIYINNQKTSYELENEKTSYDIVTAISDYAAKSNPQHFITNIIIDKKEYSFADKESLENLKINDIKELKVLTGDVYGITSLSIDQIEEFLLLLQSIFENKKWDDVLKNIQNSFKWMREGMLQIIRIYDPKGEVIVNEKETFFLNLNKFGNLMNNIDQNSFFNNDKLLKQGLEYIKKIIWSVVNIKKVLVYSYRLPDRNFILNNMSNVILNIDKIIPQLENVTILFQTGEDKEAMGIIQNLTSVLEESIGLFILFKERFKLHMDKYTVKEVEFNNFFKTITNHLKELMNSIKNNDSVMIGDLLEYEFIPNIEEIKNILLKIKEEAFTKAN